MRQHDLETSTSTLVLFVMLLTVGAIAPHSYYTATHAGGLARASAERWAEPLVVRSSEPRAPAPVARPSASVPRGRDRTRDEALLLFMLLGQGPRGQLGPAR